MSHAQRAELHVGSNVYTLEGEKVGRLRFLVVDPDTAAYSHLVLEKGGSLEHDIMIPTDRVGQVLHRGIYLNAKRSELQEMEEFPESVYSGRDRPERQSNSGGSGHSPSGGGGGGGNRRGKRYRRHRD